MIQAVIFDMDGLMVDTEPLHSLSYEMVLKEYGKTPIRDEKTGLLSRLGLMAHDNWLRLKESHGLEEDVETLKEKKRAAYRGLMEKGVTPMPGLHPLLEKLKGNYKIGLASASIRIHILSILAQLNITEYFDAVVSGEDVARGKPDPEIFLLAARKLDVRPEDCVVLEDSEAGIQAAKAAGMHPIAVPNEYTREHNFEPADRIVDSLDKIDLELLKGLR